MTLVDVGVLILVSVVLCMYVCVAALWIEND